MECLKCQHENREGRRFCAECGALLSQACSTCTFVNEPGEKFCDLVGSTALSEQLDPEDLPNVIQAYQAACTEVIQHFDGHVAQGDGLLVYFGYPQAHEDNAQHRCRPGSPSGGLGVVLWRGQG